MIRNIPRKNVPGIKEILKEDKNNKDINSKMEGKNHNSNSKRINGHSKMEMSRKNKMENESMHMKIRIKDQRSIETTTTEITRNILESTETITTREKD